MKYEMTQAQLEKILHACRSVPLIMLNAGMPRSQQENANDAWKDLGDEMGFVWGTVKPSSEGDRIFFADPKSVESSAVEEVGQ